MPAWVLVFVTCLFLANCSDKSETAPLHIIGKDNNSCFDVEIADNHISRASGLMHRKGLEEHRGMLFIYEQPTIVAFWMRNVSFPLDIIFISDTGQILHIHKNAIPYDDTPITSGKLVKYVLEINDGITERARISVGDEILLPIENRYVEDC